MEIYMNIMSLTAVELGKRIKAKEISVEEAVTAALDAIEKKEKLVNSFVTVDRELPRFRSLLRSRRNLTLHPDHPDKSYLTELHCKDLSTSVCGAALLQHDRYGNHHGLRKQYCLIHLSSIRRCYPILSLILHWNMGENLCIRYERI